LGVISNIKINIRIPNIYQLWSLFDRMEIKIEATYIKIKNYTCIEHTHYKVDLDF